MTARRFPCAFVLLCMMILLGTDRTAFGRQAAAEAEARSQTEEKREKTDGKPRTVQVATIKKTNLYNYKGRYQVAAYPSRTAKLYTNTSGTVRGLKLRLGDRVKQGETIAEIESAELRREIETRELSVRRAEIALERTKTQIRRMEKLIDIKKNKHFNRKNNPLKLEAELGVMREELDVAKLKMEESKINLEEAKLSLNQACERLASARYVAPFEGSLTEINVEEGLRVVTSGFEQGKPAFVLGDFRIVQFRLEESLITFPSVEPGMKAAIFAGSEETDPISLGSVVWVDPHRDKTTSAGRFIVEAPNSVKTLKYLDDAWVAIRTTVQKGVLTILSRSLFVKNNDLSKYYCYIVSDQKIRKTKIQISLGGFAKDDPRSKYDSSQYLDGRTFKNNSAINKDQLDQIECGLKEGDVVVIAVESGSIDDLVDGEKVVIKPANEKDKSDP